MQGVGTFYFYLKLFSSNFNLKKVYFENLPSLEKNQQEYCERNDNVECEDEMLFYWRIKHISFV